MIFALISSYKEGDLLRSCVQSAHRGCDRVALFEGPVGNDAESDDSTHLDIATGVREFVWTKIGRWASDADKRNDMLLWAKSRFRNLNGQDDKDPLWVLWLDGDEVLVWGEYLRDWCGRATQETGAGGFPLRLVEMDGSVAHCYGKIIRAGVVKAYLQSSLQVQLHNDMVVALPNVQICGPGGIPTGWGDGQEIKVEDLAIKRPPLQGEPHLLHRSLLRDPSRVARRMHEDEATWFEQKQELQ